MRKFEKKEIIMIILIGTILVLMSVVGFLLINKNLNNSNNRDYTTTTTTTIKADNANYDCFKEKLSTRCIVYENDNITLVSTKNNGNYNLFINVIYIGESDKGRSNKRCQTLYKR